MNWPAEGLRWNASAVAEGIRRAEATSTNHAAAHCIFRPIIELREGLDPIGRHLRWGSQLLWVQCVFVGTEEQLGLWFMQRQTFEIDLRSAVKGQTHAEESKHRIIWSHMSAWVRQCVKMSHSFRPIVIRYIITGQLVMRFSRLSWIYRVFLNQLCVCIMLLFSSSLSGLNTTSYK